jgi:outer membrane protein TolC
VTGQIGPAFQWPILNYGRLLNNVRYQDYKTQELTAVYQQKVLVAAQEVEGGIVSFLNARRETEKLADSVKAAERAVKLTGEQLKAGAIDFTSVFVASQFLAQQQNQYAQAQADIALGLITTYRALGGGWEIRLTDPAACAPQTPAHALRARLGRPH